MRAGAARMSDWVAFYNSEHSIYVNARHRDLHYREVAEAIVGYVPSPAASVLDYGCGEALHADVITARAARVILGEAAANVRANLTARFAGNTRIEVRSPEEIAQFPDASLDVVVMNSVAQYLSMAEFDTALALFRRLLPPGGLLLIADVIRPDLPPATDAWELLKYAACNGVL